MFFHSFEFLQFFLLVFAVYWAMPWHRARVWWLLGCSFYFYAVWSRELAILVACTSVMDYFLGRGMEATQGPRLRKLCLLASLVVNLGLLCYFKYANFFLDALRDMFARAGYTSTLPVLEVLVPFGISFYTFEAISYTIDVYRGRMKAEKNLANFMLFILFFPHLVAGPIVRAWDFLPQAARPKKFSWLRMKLGLQLLSLGLFKKLALADWLARYSDAVFDNPQAYSSGSVWIGVIAFGMRIFCDFSGYSDMALGTAHMLGFKLTRNFNMPYLSLNVSEFWRRWHISLSTWLRDYLFIPLGGSRGSGWKVGRNLMITMLLGGLWHGANWSYVIWGALHGSFLVIHRLFRGFSESRPRLKAMLETVGGKAFRMGVTFFWVMMAWIFFQPSLAKAGLLLEKMLFPQRGLHFDFPRAGWTLAILTLVVAHMFGAWSLSRRWFEKAPAPVLAVGCAALVFLGLMLVPDATKVFIYFQF